MAFFAFSPRTTAEDIARALDPRTPRGELVSLATHRDASVRAAVALSVDASMASLISLALQRDAQVREALVDNPSNPLWVIQTLASDSRAEIRGSAFARLRVLGSTV